MSQTWLISAETDFEKTLLKAVHQAVVLSKKGLHDAAATPPNMVSVRGIEMPRIGGPFGAVVLAHDGTILGTGSNRVMLDNDASMHGEIAAFRDAIQRGNKGRLKGSILVTSCDPCPMCFTRALEHEVASVVYLNSTEEADEIGFRDDFFWEELYKKPMSSRDRFFQVSQAETRIEINSVLVDLDPLYSVFFFDWDTGGIKAKYKSEALQQDGESIAIGALQEWGKLQNHFLHESYGIVVRDEIPESAFWALKWASFAGVGALFSSPQTIATRNRYQWDDLSTEDRYHLLKGSEPGTISLIRLPNGHPLRIEALATFKEWQKRRATY